MISQNTPLQKSGAIGNDRPSIAGTDELVADPSISKEAPAKDLIPEGAITDAEKLEAEALIRSHSAA